MLGSTFWVWCPFAFKAYNLNGYLVVKPIWLWLLVFFVFIGQNVRLGGGWRLIGVIDLGKKLHNFLTQNLNIKKKAAQAQLMDQSNANYFSKRETPTWIHLYKFQQKKFISINITIIFDNLVSIYLFIQFDFLLTM